MMSDRIGAATETDTEVVDLMGHRKSERHRLEREIALEAARSDVVSCCLLELVDQTFWYDTRRVDQIDRYGLDKSIRYLKLVGRLLLHPTRPDLVRVLNPQEDEALSSRC